VAGASGGAQVRWATALPVMLMASAGALAAAGSPAGADLTPRLTLSLSTGLTDGEDIAVSGSGFPPGLRGIMVGQCAAGPASARTCNQDGGVQPVDADASGDFGPVPLRLAAAFGDIDCQVGGCLVIALPPHAKAPVAVEPIAFAAGEANTMLAPATPT